MNTRTQELLDNAKRAIGARREKRAAILAYWAWACPSGPITSEMLANAADHDWAQLAHAAHVAERPAGRIHDRHYVPSIETRKAVLAILRRLEQQQVKGVAA